MPLGSNAASFVFNPQRSKNTTAHPAKHYYEVIGDLANHSEECLCAPVIAHTPEVYKGTHLADGADSRERKALGELWAARLHEQCLFLMANGPDGLPASARRSKKPWLLGRPPSCISCYLCIS
jgi:hypothetical protein